MEAPLVGFESSFDRDVAHCLAVDAEGGGDDLDGDTRTVLICNPVALGLVTAHLGLSEPDDCAIIEHRIDYACRGGERASVTSLPGEDRLE